MVGIYKITNPKGKAYIGQSVDVGRRKMQYSSPNKYCQGTKIYNSLKKYGIENHNFEIIEECSEEKLNEREKYWINKLNTIEKGLNVDVGGKNSPRTKEIKEKIRKAKLGKNSKKINQYNLNNQFIKTWPSIVSAENEYGKGIKDVLVGKIFTAHNYIWRYENDPLPLDYKFEKYKSHKRIIHQYDLKENFIKEWDSIVSIQDELGFASSNISACCLGKQKTAYGFKWKYGK